MSHKLKFEFLYRAVFSDLPIHLLSVNVFFFSLYHLSFSQGIEYSDSIVAVVNDDVITAYDVASYNIEAEKKIHSKYSGKDMKNFEIRNRLLEDLNSNRIAATNDLINQKLIYAEFLKKGYQLPSGLVDKRVDAIASSQADGDWKKFEEMLIESGTTIEELRERVERNLAVELLMSQTVDRNINISPDQIESYYREHLDEYSEPARVRLQIIGLTHRDGETSKEHRRRLDEVLALLKDRGEFREVAKSHSDLSNKNKGGDLGWMSVNDIRHEFKEGLRTIAKNEISRPIELNGTTYLVGISDFQPEKMTPLDDVFYPIKNRLFSSEKKKRYEEYIDELRSQSYVRVFFKE